MAKIRLCSMPQPSLLTSVSKYGGFPAFARLVQRRKLSVVPMVGSPPISFACCIFQQPGKYSYSCMLQKWKQRLLRMCAHYLLNVRRRNLAFDPVANFHLRNGATVWRLNWAADTSPHGLSASFGIMVNYEYVLDKVHSNSQTYLVDRSIPAAQAVKDLAQGSG